MDLLLEIFIGLLVTLVIILACIASICCYLNTPTVKNETVLDQEESTNQPNERSESISGIEFLASDITPEILRQELHTR
jgi:hypothetical protein